MVDEKGWKSKPEKKTETWSEILKFVEKEKKKERKKKKEEKKTNFWKKDSEKEKIKSSDEKEEKKKRMMKKYAKLTMIDVDGDESMIDKPSSAAVPSNCDVHTEVPDITDNEWRHKRRGTSQTSKRRQTRAARDTTKTREWRHTRPFAPSHRLDGYKNASTLWRLIEMLKQGFVGPTIKAQK